MRKPLLRWSVTAAMAATLVFSSCTYDPYYSSSGGYYSSGYGYGYGYGGSSFSTSLFVTTGDPRWGYDPHTYCYYDYRSRRYYDPYLYGYYPIGYRPPVVYGVPHPYGWRPGRGYCPPPRTVRNVTVVNYRNREDAYRSSRYSWAGNVKQRPYGDSYRQSDSGRRPYGNTRTNYRRDSHDDRSSDRGFFSPQVRPPQENRTRERTIDSRGSRATQYRGGYRSTDRSIFQQAVQTETREISPPPRPESTRSGKGRSFDRSRDNIRQFERQPEFRGRSQERREAPQMREAPRSSAPEAPAAAPDPSPGPSREGRRGLRSLGDG